MAVKPEVDRCAQRELVLKIWTDSSTRVRKLLDERYAAMRNGAPSPDIPIEEQIRLARTAEVEACRAYFRHVNSDDCA